MLLIFLLAFFPYFIIKLLKSQHKTFLYIIRDAFISPEYHNQSVKRLNIANYHQKTQSENTRSNLPSLHFHSRPRFESKVVITNWILTRIVRIRDASHDKHSSR